MGAQEVQDPEKVWTVCAGNLNGMVNKMNNTKLLKIDMKQKDAYKLDTGELDKCETYPKNKKLPEDDLYQPCEQHVNQKHKLLTLSGVKIDIG